MPQPQAAAAERRVSTAAGPQLPDLPPDASKFVVTQVKEMERLISRVEKEDSYEMFRTEVDPIDKLKGTADAACGGSAGGRGQPPRRRPRKGAGAGVTSDDGMDVDEDEQGEEVKKGQVVAGRGAMVLLSDREKARQPPPINIPQIRERFVNGHYLPAPGSYLIQPKESSETAASTAITSAAAAAAATASTSSPSAPADATAAAASRRTQNKDKDKQDKDKKDKAASSTSTSGSRARSTSPLLQQAKEEATESKQGASVESKSASEQDRGKDNETPVVVALNKDSGRLGPNAKLTYDYEPLLDWTGLRADVVGLVNRLVRGADDWRVEKEHARNQRRQRRRRRRCRGGGSAGSGDGGNGAEREGGGEEEEGDDDDDDDDGDEGVDEYLESARRFSSTVGELVTKQLEKTEKDVSVECSTTLVLAQFVLRHTLKFLASCLVLGYSSTFLGARLL